MANAQLKLHPTPLAPPQAAEAWTYIRELAKIDPIWSRQALIERIGTTATQNALTYHTQEGTVVRKGEARYAIASHLADVDPWAVTVYRQMKSVLLASIPYVVGGLDGMAAVEIYDRIDPKQTYSRGWLGSLMSQLEREGKIFKVGYSRRGNIWARVAEAPAVAPSEAGPTIEPAVVDPTTAIELVDSGDDRDDAPSLRTWILDQLRKGPATSQSLHDAMPGNWRVRPNPRQIGRLLHQLEASSQVLGRKLSSRTNAKTWFPAGTKVSENGAPPSRVVDIRVEPWKSMPPWERMMYAASVIGDVEQSEFENCEATVLERLAAGPAMSPELSRVCFRVSRAPHASSFHLFLRDMEERGLIRGRRGLKDRHRWRLATDVEADAATEAPATVEVPPEPEPQIEAVASMPKPTPPSSSLSEEAGWIDLDDEQVQICRFLSGQPPMSARELFRRMHPGEIVKPNPLIRKLQKLMDSDIVERLRDEGTWAVTWKLRDGVMLHDIPPAESCEDPEDSEDDSEDSTYAAGPTWVEEDEWPVERQAFIWTVVCPEGEYRVIARGGAEVFARFPNADMVRKGDVCIVLN